MMKSAGVLWLILAPAAPVVAQNKYAGGIRIKILKKLRSLETKYTGLVSTL